MKKLLLSPLLGLLVAAGVLSNLQAQSVYERYPFSTFAGNPPGSVDGTGANARFNLPESVAVDADGNVYVADTANNVIRKITPAGLTSTLAGLAGSSGSDNGQGSAARFNSPVGIAVDSLGNLYIGDTLNDCVRKITPAGLVTTVAGSPGESGSADGNGGAARFFSPRGLAIDGSGNIYVADSDNGTIRKITPSGDVTTIAGTAGNFGSNNGNGASASFAFPSSVAIDGSGNVYVADMFNSTIRKITSAGDVSTFAGKPAVRGSTDATGGNARFNFPEGVAVDTAGNVYVADGSNQTIRKITPAGVVSTLAGSPLQKGAADGSGSSARFFDPTGLAVGGDGAVYVADRNNNAIRKITSGGSVSTLAGAVGGTSSADGIGSAARFDGPGGVALDGSGNLYVADTENHTIRKITPGAAVTTVAGSAGSSGATDGTGSAARFNAPSGVAVDLLGNVYVADSGNHTIRKITPAGATTTLAGEAGVNGSSDGGSAAHFDGPSGIAVDSLGNVYVADTFNSTIRKITPAGEVSTFAGSAGVFGSADGTGGAASFNLPGAIAVDADGNLFVADTANSTIRKISSAGVVTTLAGSAESAGSADGTGENARFNNPEGIAVDSLGNVFVADTANSVIRKITSAGVSSTIAGVPGTDGSTDGRGSAAHFNNLRGIAVDAAGFVYVGDTQSNTIRRGGPTAASQALNISTRAQVQDGDNVLIGGFIITGSAPKQVIIRALGPSLAQQNVAGPLVNPTLELHDANGLAASNDDWKTNDETEESQEAAIRATGLAPNSESESVILVTLAPNHPYTAIVRGKDGTTGVALVEVYDLNPTTDSLFANISTRGLVGTGDDVLIGGFILGNNAAERVVVRALGPSLANKGVSGVLQDTVLELHDMNGSVITNDDWNATQAAELQAVGLGPDDPRESAILATLPPGPYTAIVRGKNGTTGVGLVEIYDVQ